MPIADYHRWSTWQAFYDVSALPTRQDIRLSYHRAIFYATIFNERATVLPPKLGWTSASHIAVLGCGFGWFVEQMRAHGFSFVVGFDNSAYLQTMKDTTEEADIDAAIRAAGLDPRRREGAAIKAQLWDGGTRARVEIFPEDGMTPESRARMARAFPDQHIDVVYTETLVEGLTDSEALTLSIGLRELAPVTHLITTERPASPVGRLNWKTLRAWKTLLTPDTCVEDGTYIVA